MEKSGIVLVPTTASSADRRWAAWVAKGIEHDRRMKDRAMLVAIAVTGGLALWATIALVF
jgi:hypothetical protein